MRYRGNNIWPDERDNRQPKNIMSRNCRVAKTKVNNSMRESKRLTCSAHVVDIRDVITDANFGDDRLEF